MDVKKPTCRYSQDIPSVGHIGEICRLNMHESHAILWLAADSNTKLGGRGALLYPAMAHEVDDRGMPVVGGTVWNRQTTTPFSSNASIYIIYREREHGKMRNFA